MDNVLSYHSVWNTANICDTTDVQALYRVTCLPWRLLQHAEKGTKLQTEHLPVKYLSISIVIETE